MTIQPLEIKNITPLQIAQINPRPALSMTDLHGAGVYAPCLTGTCNPNNTSNIRTVVQRARRAGLTGSRCGADWPAFCRRTISLDFSCLPACADSLLPGSICLPANHNSVVAASRSSCSLCKPTQRTAITHRAPGDAAGHLCHSRHMIGIRFPQYIAMLAAAYWFNVKFAEQPSRSVEGRAAFEAAQEGCSASHAAAAHWMGQY